MSAANTSFTYVSSSPAERLVDTYCVGCPATPRYDTHGQHCVGRVGMEHHLLDISGLTHTSRRNTSDNRSNLSTVLCQVPGIRFGDLPARAEANDLALKLFRPGGLRAAWHRACDIVHPVLAVETCSKSAVQRKQCPTLALALLWRRSLQVLAVVARNC